MNTKPITPKMHGIIDYVFSATLLTMPRLLGLNKKAVNTYNILGSGLLGINAITNHSVGLKPVILYNKTHYMADLGNLATFASLFLSKSIKNDKKALAFHAGVFALATAHVVLTDWNMKPDSKQEMFDY